MNTLCETVHTLCIW